MKDNKTEMLLAPVPKQFVLGLRPKTELLSAVTPQYNSGGANALSAKHDMDRILEYSQVPTIE